MKKDHRIIFLHIPKTAGLTFHHILNNQYPIRRQRIIAVHSDYSRFMELPDNKRNKIRVLKGHVSYGVHLDLPPNQLYITFLRHPINRVISLYEYILTYKHHPLHQQIVGGNFTLSQVLDQKLIRNADNGMVRNISGLNLLPVGEIGQEHLDRAIANLNNPNLLFGITERFDHSILYFQQKLNWSTPWYHKQNANMNKQIQYNSLDDSTQQLLQHYTKYDMQLYNVAVEKFNQTINSLGNDFSTKVSKFQQENASHSWVNTTFQKIKFKLAMRWQLF